MRKIADDDRPEHVASPRRMEERDLGDLFGLPLSRAAGARTVFVCRDRVTPGGRTSPLHAHTGDEELVVVLAGNPTLRQLRGAVVKRVMDFEGGQVEETTLQPGDVARWRPGDAVAHQLVNESDVDAVLLTIGTHRPDDLCLFPSQGTVHVRALERTAAFTRLEYFDGETPGGGSYGD